MTSTKTRQAAAELFLTVYPRFKHLLTTQFHQQVEDEITFSQSRTLGKLVDQPLTLSTLAERLNMSRQGASLQVQSLVEHGWVRRRPDPADRRSARLEVTDAGRAHWRLARRERVEYLAGVFEELTAAEIRAFLTTFLAFQRILDQADAEQKSASPSGAADGPQA